MRLTDPWFEAHFVAIGAEGYSGAISGIEGAQGVQFYCPCRRGEAQGHILRVGFVNPRGAAPSAKCTLRSGATGEPLFWQMSGTGLHDLSLSPSVEVWKFRYVDPADPSKGTERDGSCWHGFITNGEVT